MNFSKGIKVDPLYLSFLRSLALLCFYSRKGDTLTADSLYAVTEYINLISLCLTLRWKMSAEENIKLENFMVHKKSLFTDVNVSSKKQERAKMLKNFFFTVR
jgi:hypothetical protein